MRIKRFHESVSNELKDIDNLLVDFEDETDFRFELKSAFNYINLIGTTKNLNYNKLNFMKKIYELVERVSSFGYKNIDKGNVISLMPGKCEVQLQFVDEIEEELKVPEINSFEEFKEFLKNSLKLKFFEFDSELYIPNNDPDHDILVNLWTDEDIFQLYDNEMNYSEGNPRINWAALKSKSDVEFLESILMNLNELIAGKYYDENGEATSRYNLLYNDEGDDLSKDEVKKLQNSYKEKTFKFDKKGLEVILKLYNILKDVKEPLILPYED